MKRILIILGVAFLFIIGYFYLSTSNRNFVGVWESKDFGTHFFYPDGTYKIEFNSGIERGEYSIKPFNKIYLKNKTFTPTFSSHINELFNTYKFSYSFVNGKLLLSLEEEIFPEGKFFQVKKFDKEKMGNREFSFINKIE